MTHCRDHLYRAERGGAEYRALGHPTLNLARLRTVTIKFHILRLTRRSTFPTLGRLMPWFTSSVTNNTWRRPLIGLKIRLLIRQSSSTRLCAIWRRPPEGLINLRDRLDPCRPTQRGNTPLTAQPGREDSLSKSKR